MKSSARELVMLAIVVVIVAVVGLLSHRESERSPSFDNPAVLDSIPPSPSVQCVGIGWSTHAVENILGQPDLMDEFEWRYLGNSGELVVVLEGDEVIGFESGRVGTELSIELNRFVVGSTKRSEMVKALGEPSVEDTERAFATQSRWQGEGWVLHTFETYGVLEHFLFWDSQRVREPRFPLTKKVRP